VQIRAHVVRREAPPPPPETFGPYTKKTEESGGVIAMIDLLVKDLDKEMQEAEVMEKDSQKEYEEMMADAASKRATDAKSITEKEGAKATTEGELEQEKDKKTASTKELLATVDYIQSLHSECDWLLQNFDARKEARASEVEALKNAKAQRREDSRSRPPEFATQQQPVHEQQNTHMITCLHACMRAIIRGNVHHGRRSWRPVSHWLPDGVGTKDGCAV